MTFIIKVYIYLIYLIFYMINNSDIINYKMSFIYLIWNL